MDQRYLDELKAIRRKVEKLEFPPPRDQYAMAVLPALMADECRCIDQQDEPDYNAVAKRAYRMADAMLAMRTG